MIKLILACMALLTLSGCTVGQSDFNCSAGDDNALCGSTRSIYKATNGELDENTKITYIVDGEVHQTDVDNLEALKGSLKNPDGNNYNKNKKIVEKMPISEKKPDQVLFEQSQQEMSLSVGDVMRTKASIMKVGINRWIDSDDLFHMGSIILVDIESRRWNVKKDAQTSPTERVIPYKAVELQKATSTSTKKTGSTNTSAPISSSKQ